VRLTDEYIAEARRRAYRFQGQWTGTSGALAADVARVLKEREQMMSTIAELEQNNAAMRAAVESRGVCCDGGKCHSPPALNLPEGYADYTLTPAVPVPEATFEDPIPVAAMPQEQLEAAWAGVKERQRELHERLRDPYAADPLERRVVGDASALPAAAKPAVIPQAGTTAKFGTGAVRSDTFEQFRYDLVSPIGLREVARACAEGAEKYSDFNWERGMPVNDLLNHAIAHVYQFLSGDRSEPHLGHAAWNLLAAIHSHELWTELNDGKLRGPGCKPPT
jgi:hypothetical protein